MSETIPAAAIQISVQPGALHDNLAHVEELAEQALKGGARLVALPEFFTSAMISGTPGESVVLPAGDNPAQEMLSRLAKKYQATIGGSFLVAEDEDIRNRYHLAEPDGSVHVHDKDLPTMWENAFYAGGHDDGVLDTALGGVGAAVCWELIREQTLARMRGRVEFAITGTHWWTMPANWPGVDALLGPLSQFNRYLSEQAPVEFARRLGAPVLQASHSGTLDGYFYLLPGTDLRVPYTTRFVGATQIVDAHGQVLASRNATAGPGVVHADLTPGALTPVEPPVPQRYWVPRLPLLLRLYWHHQNAVGRSLYRRRGREAGLAAARGHGAGG